MITFDQWTSVTMSPTFLIALGIIWFVAFVFYFLTGAGISMTSKGRKSHFWGSTHFWVGMATFFFIIPLLTFFGIIYPFWISWIHL